MQLSKEEKACWFIAMDTLYIAGPFYTKSQAENYLKTCKDSFGFITINIEGEQYAYHEDEVYVVRDLNWG